MKQLFLAATVALFAFPAAAHTEAGGAYARITNPVAGIAAIYLYILNHNPGDERLVSVESDAAERVEIHATEVDANGIATMRHLPDGITIPPGESVELEPGGLHIMMLGLTEEYEVGDTIPIRLILDAWIPIDLQVEVVDDIPGETETHSGHDH